MTRKYKILPYRDGFKVWKLTNYGSGIGCGWEDVGLFFRSREDAEKYIKEAR